jgi:hypothetical protein
VKEDEVSPYPEVRGLLEKAKEDTVNEGSSDVSESLAASMSLAREYYTRTTDRVRFSSRKIVVFDKETMSYKPNDWYTPEAMRRIMERLHGGERQEFLQFYYQNWRQGKGLEQTGGEASL